MVRLTAQGTYKLATRDSVVATFAAALLLLVMVPILEAGNGNAGNPGVIPPNAKAYGMTYGEWSAKWWQWAVSLPLDNNPLYDNTVDCSTGQLGSVWFLGGSFNVSSTAERDCTVPSGKALFFPIINVDCSNLETPPFFGATEADRKACVKSIIDTATALSCEVDGVPIQNLTQYRFLSPNFTFTVPPENVLGISPPGSGEMVADGFYVMLAPLAVGQHTIRFSGTLSEFGFTLHILYHLTVR